MSYNKFELKYLSRNLPSMFDESTLEDSCPGNKSCNLLLVNLAGWGWGGVVFFLISCQVYLLACSLWQGGASLTTCLSHLVFANGDALIQQLSPEGLSNMFRSLAYSLAYS